MAAEALTKGAWPRVQWGPVLAGVLCALAAHIVLGLFGAALGLASNPADSKGLGIGAGIWGLLTPFVASLLGAWVAVRVAGDRHGAGAMLHGALVWAIGLIAGAVFLTGAMSTGAMTAGAAASGNVGARAVERHDTPQNRARAEATAEDAAKGAAAGSGAAGLAALLGIGGALLGAGMGRRMVTGEGLRPSRGIDHRREVRAEMGTNADLGNAHIERTTDAYTARAGQVTTRNVDRTDGHGTQY